MVRFVALWSLIKATGPTFWLMSAAFVYGAKKWGEGSWRTQSADEHLAIALDDILAFRKGGTDKPFLVDAALRVAFAVAVAVERKQQPAEYVKPLPPVEKEAAS